MNRPQLSREANLALPACRLARRARSRGAGAILLLGAAVVTTPAWLAGGCAQQTIVPATRALERSGRMAFVCLDWPKSGKEMETGAHEPRLHPIEDCNATQVLSLTQYTTDADAGVETALPHLYALVTQTTRGEVAVIDTTSQNYSVLDEDPTVPGANFLPIGALPVDIVATRGGTATFVSVAEPGREAIFALPSKRILPASTDPVAVEADDAGSAAPPEISGWPSCRLPGAPGPMILVDDADQACGKAYDSNGHVNGDLTAEHHGRQKLVVTLPDLGQIAVIDAQSILDSRDPVAGADGANKPCKVDQWLTLSAAAPKLAAPPPPSGAACVDPTPRASQDTGAPALKAHPSGITFADGRLYVSDLGAPLVHVIDMPTPCSLKEVEPLRPTSALEPTRVVTTSHVAASPALTTDLKRYLFAIDAEDASAMVFDISDDQRSPFPVQRPHPEYDPFEPPDRIRFSSPVADLVILQRDATQADPRTGVAVEGLRCDSDPSLVTCTTDNSAAGTKTCDVATLYRTTSTYDSGAGPKKLRGVFAIFALASGKLAVIDIDDYDADCRGPRQPSPLLGCTDVACTKPNCTLASSGELSCNVVERNTPRMATYFADVVTTGQHAPGLQIFPLLYNVGGVLLARDRPTEAVRSTTALMVATLPSAATPTPLTIAVGGQPFPVGPGCGSSQSICQQGIILQDTAKDTLLMNLEDPRAQVVDQSWTVTFEGALPGFADHVGLLGLKAAAGTSDASGTFNDADGRFCDRGVQSEAMRREQLLAQKTPSLTLDQTAADQADRVQISEQLAALSNPFWTGKTACSFDSCVRVFGGADTPLPGREFVIAEAFQDHLTLRRGPFNDANNKQIELVDTEGAPISVPAFTQCCFPTQVHFNIRPGRQWVVSGSASGFMHHVVADPASGRCRDSCARASQRLNGRVFEAPPMTEPKSGAPSTPTVVHDGEAFAFINPMFRFAILSSTSHASQRDDQFRFATTGAFTPLLIPLSSDPSVQTLIQPVGMTIIPATNEIAVTDGLYSGMLVVTPSSVAVSRQYR
jgi:hypothetical protein